MTIAVTSIQKCGLVKWNLDIKGFGTRVIEGTIGTQASTFLWCRNGNFELIFRPVSFDGQTVEAELVDIVKL